jgi:alpha-L-arabinofuranosidase
MLNSQNEEHRMQVDVSESVAKIQPTMYGVFFEDINFAADGGLYTSAVKDVNTNELIIKVVNTGAEGQNIKVDIKSIRVGSEATVCTWIRSV